MAAVAGSTARSSSGGADLDVPFGALISGDSDASSLETYNIRVRQLSTFYFQIHAYPMGTMIWPSNLGLSTGGLSYFSQWLWGGFIGGILYILIHLWAILYGIRSYMTARVAQAEIAALTLAGLGVAFAFRAAGAGSGLHVPSSFVFWLIAGACVGVLHRYRSAVVLPATPARVTPLHMSAIPRALVSNCAEGRRRW